MYSETCMQSVRPQCYLVVCCSIIASYGDNQQYKSQIKRLLTNMTPKSCRFVQPTHCKTECIVSDFNQGISLNLCIYRWTGLIIACVSRHVMDSWEHQHLQCLLLIKKEQRCRNRVTEAPMFKDSFVFGCAGVL